MIDQEQGSVLDQTLVLSFFQGNVSNRRRIGKDRVGKRGEELDGGEAALVETDIDHDMLHVSKDLFDSPELKAIGGQARKARAAIKSLALPSFYRSGMYLVKMDAVKAVDGILEDQAAAKDALVEAFVAAIPQRKAEAKERLGAAFEEADYPTDAQVRKAFRWEFKWLTLATPSKLKQISQALFEREARKAQESLESAVKGFETLLASEAKVFVDRLVDRLTPGADGKRKVFRDSLTGNISEFIKAYPLRNLGSSKDLDDLMGKMGQLLEGVDPASLRSNDRLAQDLRAGFQEVQAQLEVVAQPERLIELEG